MGGLLTFASPDRVYATYLQAFALLTPAVLLCAWVVRSGRLPLLRTRLERWGWRIALVGYGFLSLGLVLAFVVVAFASGGALNVVFLAFIVPGIFLGTIGSTVLGIGLLRASYRPRLAAWLLAAAFPFWFFASDVLGHNSLGLLPIFAAWAVIGWRLWRAQTGEPEPLAG